MILTIAFTEGEKVFAVDLDGALKEINGNIQEDGKSFVSDVDVDNREFGGHFATSRENFDGKFGEVHTITRYVGGEPYAGDYVVTPKVEAQTFPTKEKVMVDDMTITAIPFFSVSNTSGGNTVYIAKEI